MRNTKNYFNKIIKIGILFVAVCTGHVLFAQTDKPNNAPILNQTAEGMADVALNTIADAGLNEEQQNARKAEREALEKEAQRLKHITEAEAIAANNEQTRTRQYWENYERQRTPQPQQPSASGKNSSRPGFASTTKIQFLDPSADFTGAAAGQNAPNTVLVVRITGNDQIGAKELIKIIKTRPGRPFSPVVLEEDKRALMQKTWFIDVKPKVEKTPSGYIITFQFIERPILHYVKFIGNNAHTRKILLEEANIKPGDALDPIAVHQAKERLVQFYHDSGYYRVHIEILTGDQLGDRGVVFLISEGPKQRILETEFEGNHIATSARLKTLIQSKPGLFFWINSEFTRPKLEEDVETLTAYYRKLGFFYAKIDRQFVETNGYTGLGENRSWVKVKFIIDEGPRCRVREIRFAGNHVFSKDELFKTMKLPGEKYFNQDMLESDMKRLKDKYGDQGYVFTAAEPDPRIDEDFVDVVINIKEGPRGYLRTLHIEIVGNDGADPYTKWHPILNRSSLRPGDILRTSEINNSRRRLMASQLFNANPTQGSIPEFLFDFPEEALEDAENEEREALKLAEATSQIRGQSPPARPFFWNKKIIFHKNDSLEKDSLDNSLKPESSESQSLASESLEGEMNHFSEFFRIKFKPSPKCSGSLDSSSGNSSGGASGGLPGDSSGLYSVRKEVYRGQTFTSPRTVTPANISANTPVNTPVNTPASIYVPPTFPNNPINNNVNIANQYYPNTVSAAVSPTALPPTVSPTLLPTLSPMNLSGSIAPATTPLGQQNAMPSGYQNSGYQNAVSSTGPYGTTYYSASYAQPSQSSFQTPQAMTVLGQPTNITPPEYQQTSYLSPPSNNSNVGNGVLYNQGMIFTQHKVNQSANQPVNQVILGNPYASLGDNTNIRIDPNAPPGVSNKIYPVDGRWLVQETRTGQLMMSVAVSSDAGLMGRFIIEEQNFDILNFPKGFRLSDWKNAFRGKGQRFRIEAVPGTEVQRYSASWETPYLFDLDYSFGVSGFYYERYYDEWYEDRIGGSISFGKLWTPDFSTRLILGGQQVKIYRPVYPYSQDLIDTLGHHPMYTIGLEATYNTRDSEYMPTEGHLITFGVEQVLGDYQFIRGNIDFRKYFMLHERPDRSGRWVLGIRSSLGISEKNTPIYERYFGGGFTSLRGFEYRGITPRDSNDAILGGCMEFYNSAELVFPITADDMIRGSVFVDTGTVEKSITKWESDYRVAVGFGLRLTIPMMGPAPIALDFAFPISKDRRDERQVFSFNVGFMR
ncbi:MAG: BamA/TamA family outer membrane protein [Planctomycetaceae bacterium]|nr:BamA/TamA family outer membrane protein [Planctomycetaceae bacterium]